MSRINLETIKKLLSVKKGGAEIFRLLVKLFVWIFGLGMMFSVMYSLNQLMDIQKNLLQIKYNESYREASKIQRNCDASARIALTNVLEKAKKEKKEVKEADKKAFYNNAFGECIYLNGFDLPKNNVKKEIKK